MKKFFKVLIAIVAIVAGVAGGLFVYSKIREKKDNYNDDFDDDFDDDPSDDAEDGEERSYVNINTDSDDEVKADD